MAPIKQASFHQLAMPISFSLFLLEWRWEMPFRIGCRSQAFFVLYQAALSFHWSRGRRKPPDCFRHTLPSSARRHFIATRIFKINLLTFHLIVYLRYKIRLMAFHKKEEFGTREQSLAAFAKAISHPARIAILNALAKKNECICGELVNVLPLAQSTVSQHLKELKNAGLIDAAIDGPRNCY